MHTPDGWAVHQLVQFLADVVPADRLADGELAALRRGLERTVEALDAELGVVVLGDDIVASVGFGRDTSCAEAVRACVEDDAVVEIAGFGTCAVAAIPFRNVDGRTALLRIGGEVFTSEERTLLRGLVAALELSARVSGVLESERRQREASEQQAADALLDPLTRLPNRALFLDRLSLAVKRARRTGTTVSVLYMDLDGFKDVNDSLGHTAGDELLAAVAARMREAVRAADTIARLGGDEFAVLVEDASELDAIDVARRVQQTLSTPIRLDGRRVHPRVTIGIATGDEPGALLRDADIAMYEGKRHAPGTIREFEPDMRRALMARLSTHEALGAAVVNGELRLCYQPVVDLTSGVVKGLEALLRWDRPGYGEVSPAEFVPVAEETGAIVDIGAWVIRTACARLAAWRCQHPAARDLNVAVNVSARQLEDDAILDVIEDALAASGLPPHRLVLELTESALLHEHADDVMGRLQRIRAIGVPLALDDFGTGYSSLTHLVRLPAAIVKIDRSFVAHVSDEGDPTASLVASVIRIANDRGLDAVAEGIETEPQAAALRAMGCRYGQGFHYARPLDASDLEAVVFAPTAPFRETHTSV